MAKAIQCRGQGESPGRGMSKTVVDSMATAVAMAWPRRRIFLAEPQSIARQRLGGWPMAKAMAQP